jgi:ribosomal-protein-alanine N-acetyltransferase
MCRLENGFSELGRMRPARKGHIVSVAVVPDYRRIGVGSALMTSAISALSDYGYSEAFVEVRVTNEPAINLYSKLGFKTVKRVPRYYYNGEDAYVMALPLGDEYSRKREIT